MIVDGENAAELLHLCRKATGARAAIDEQLIAVQPTTLAKPVSRDLSLSRVEPMMLLDVIEVAILFRIHLRARGLFDRRDDVDRAAFALTIDSRDVFGTSLILPIPIAGIYRSVCWFAGGRDLQED